MSDSRFRGVIPPVVVPNTEDRRLDVPAYERNLNRMIEAGVNGLFVLGSSGQVVFSTDSDREQIIRESARIIDGRVPMLVGIMDTETERVLEHGRQAIELGADALVSTAPFYALGGPAEVEEHFRIIHDELGVPLFAYDLPVCVHTKLDWEMLVRLGEDGVLSGVKDSSGDNESFRKLILTNEVAGHPLSVLTGAEFTVDGAYLWGADGSVPGLANVEPGGYVRMWQAAQAGDWKAAREEQDRLTDIGRILSAATGLVGYARGVGSFKTALWLMGIFGSNQMPRPVKAMEGENVEAVRRILVETGLLEA